MFKIFNKKGEGPGTIGTIGAFVLIIAVVVFLLWLMRDKGDQSAEFIDASMSCDTVSGLLDSDAHGVCRTSCVAGEDPSDLVTSCNMPKKYDMDAYLARVDEWGKSKDNIDTENPENNKLCCVQS